MVDSIMNVREAMLRISNMEECQKALERLAEKEREHYFKDMFECSVKMIGEYKELLESVIENAELDKEVSIEKKRSMRRIKVVTVKGIMCAMNEDYEIPVNKALEEIEEEGNRIVNIHYCVSQKGYMEGVVIEFEVGGASSQ